MGIIIIDLCVWACK